MAEQHAFVAFDLGAESGRAMLAVLADGKLELEEAHRFANLPQRLPSGLHWSLTDLWQHLVTGLGEAAKLAAARGLKITSVGVDTWGVDYALIGQSGQLLGLPFAYRDDRNPPAMQKAFDLLGEKAIYQATGIQFLPFNTLFQLVAHKDAEPAVVQSARRMLNIPDLLHYFFSGEMVNEATIASTTQMVDPRTGAWDAELLAKLDVPATMLGKTVPAGTKIGTIRDDVLKAAGVDGPIDVIVPGSHDTASAVAAVPVDGKSEKSWAYLSSGTWSLMGAELDEPVVTDASLGAGFTNERGVGGKIRFLKNIAGLWLVQELRRDYARKGQAFDYVQLTQMASEATPFRTLVDPGHAPFATPDDMCQKIDAFADMTDQPRPTSPGQYVRCCLESLALTYRETLQALEDLGGSPFDMLYIVGGGGKNELLNQMTADAIGRNVSAGPFEATATGNALTQAIGAGVLKDLGELRAVVRESFETKLYKPQAPAEFDAQAARFIALLGR